jgi:hypothetical protein
VLSEALKSYSLETARQWERVIEHFVGRGIPIDDMVLVSPVPIPDSAPVTVLRTAAGRVLAEGRSVTSFEGTSFRMRYEIRLAEGSDK